MVTFIFLRDHRDKPCCILLLRYLSHHRSQRPPPFLAVYHCLHSYYHMALYIQQLDPDCKPLPNPLHPYSLVVMTCHQQNSSVPSLSYEWSHLFCLFLLKLGCFRGYFHSSIVLTTRPESWMDVLLAPSWLLDVSFTIFLKIFSYAEAHRPLPTYLPSVRPWFRSGHHSSSSCLHPKSHRYIVFFLVYATFNP